MKLKEFINININDLDVGNDFCDVWYDSNDREFDAYIAFCCGPSSPLTEEGMKEFKSIMNYEVSVGKNYATVHIPGKDDKIKQKNLNKVMLYFYAHAGHISDSLYRLWFKIND